MAEDYVSVDVEALGPSPSYSMVSLGACEVANRENTFYIEIQPFSDDYVLGAMEVAIQGHSLIEKRLRTKGKSKTLTDEDALTVLSQMKQGEYPAVAMKKFASWLSQFRNPVFVAFNASFDWQFVNYYFCRWYGESPFKINSLDIKGLYMGFSGCEWRQTTKRSMPKEFLVGGHSHNALTDAQEQAQIFERVYDAIQRRLSEEEAWKSHQVWSEKERVRPGLKTRR